MSYKVGEVAEILGLSPQGVRFFERNGYLNGRRCENGYRAYERNDLTIAQQIQSYASVGFTLREAADLVLTSDLNTIEEQLAVCEERIYTMMMQLENQKRALELRQQTIERVRQKRSVEIQHEEEWLYLPLEGKGALADCSSIEREWMSNYPMIQLAKIPISTDGTPIDSKGVCVASKEAEKLGLTVPDGVIRFPAGLYWNVVILKPVGESKDYATIYRQTLDQGHCPIGPMLSIVEISFLHDNVRSTISQVKIPIKA